MFAAAPLVAQAPEASGTVFHVSPYVGYMVFGDYIKGPLGTSVSNRARRVVWNRSSVYRSRRTCRSSGTSRTQPPTSKSACRSWAASGVGNSSTLLYDAGLEYNLGRMSSRSIPLTPFLQAGVGAMKYDINAASHHHDARDELGG
jgi:hypothetical protein